MKQLFCRDLKPGDILLKMATGSLTHTIIQAGQRLMGQANAFLAHAAIALDTQFVIEAQSVGVTANHLAMKNKDCGYIVYSCTHTALAQGAATAAKLLLDINQSGGKLSYNVKGVITSIFGPDPPPKTEAEIDALLDSVLEGKGHPFFCSQFVAFVYQFAALQSGIAAASLFPMSDTKISPSLLASMLQGNAYFREAGYMLPNER
jgi:hypothetical protein